MCIANLTDYDDATAREIWAHEFALQERERLQRQSAELARRLRIVPLSLSSSPVGGFTPPTPGLPAGDGDLSEVIA